MHQFLQWTLRKQEWLYLFELYGKCTSKTGNHPGSIGFRCFDVEIGKSAHLNCVHSDFAHILSVFTVHRNWWCTGKQNFVQDIIQQVRFKVNK